MECADIAAFNFATWQIRLCLLGMFISPEATVVAVKTAQALLSRVNNEFFMKIWFNSSLQYSIHEENISMLKRRLNSIHEC